MKINFASGERSRNTIKNSWTYTDNIYKQYRDFQEGQFLIGEMNVYRLTLHYNVKTMSPATREKDWKRTLSAKNKISQM